MAIPLRKVSSSDCKGERVEKVIITISRASTGNNNDPTNEKSKFPEVPTQAASENPANGNKIQKKGGRSI